MTLVDVESLSVRTADGSRLLDEVSLSVAAGETLLLCGAPGAGKTLLAKAIEGVLRRRDDLTVDGDVRRVGDVALVFQHPEVQLVRQTVEHDAAFGLENRGVPVAEIRTRIDRYARLLGVEPLLDRDVHDLSRGETTLAALLGVLVTEPDVVVLDEPLTALDHRNAELVLDAIDRLRSHGTAVVVAEHDLRDLLSRADRVVVLDDGRVRETGDPRHLAATLRAVGAKLPVATELALERDVRGGDVPLTTDELRE